MFVSSSASRCIRLRGITDKKQDQQENFSYSVHDNLSVSSYVAPDIQFIPIQIPEISGIESFATPRHENPGLLRQRHPVPLRGHGHDQPFRWILQRFQPLRHFPLLRVCHLAAS